MELSRFSAVRGPVRVLRLHTLFPHTHMCVCRCTPCAHTYAHTYTAAIPYFLQRLKKNLKSKTNELTGKTTTFFFCLLNFLYYYKEILRLYLGEQLTTQCLESYNHHPSG